VGVTGSAPRNLVFVGGKPHHKVESGSLIDDLEQTIRAALAEQAAERDSAAGSLIAKA
jgi:(E)-4-hydroxy-3-methylbut-2-enyl-diphosphate synthase